MRQKGLGGVEGEVQGDGEGKGKGRHAVQNCELTAIFVKPKFTQNTLAPPPPKNNNKTTTTLFLSALHSLQADVRVIERRPFSMFGISPIAVHKSQLILMY